MFYSQLNFGSLPDFMLQSNLAIGGGVFNLRALISVMVAVPVGCRFCPDYLCLTVLQRLLRDSFLVKHNQTELRSSNDQ